MIRCVMVHGGGLIVALGIVEENVRKMRNGEPLHLPLGKLLAEATKAGDISPGRVSLLVAYGKTHVAIIEQWNRELAASGLDMGAAAMADAVVLDEQLRAEGLM